MRAFIGIELSDELKRKAGAIQSQFKKHAVSGRWKSIDNLHITLRFLGELTDEQKNIIDELVSDAVLNARIPALKCSDVGVFETKGRIRVLWVGLSGDMGALGELKARVDGAIKGMGFMEENVEFVPHITIGQNVKLRCNIDMIRAEIRNLAIHDAWMKVDNVMLFRSAQIDGKRVYTKVSSYELRVRSKQDSIISQK